MADEEHLKILKQGVEVWNKWRPKNDEFWPRLRKADLSQADLRYANLKRADLSQADLRRANLKRADLSQADLSQADLRQADLSQANLSRAKFCEANLSRADLHGVRISETNLDYANFSGVNLSEAEFYEVGFFSANFKGANMRKARFYRSHLKEANLIGADLREVQLSDQNLLGANLKEANLRGAELIRANLSQADLRQANLREANLRRADIRFARLSKGILSGAELCDADLTRANLIEANLCEVDLKGANLNRADLSKANLNKANIQMTTLVKTNLDDANLSNSRIYGISAWNVKISRDTKQLNLIITQDDEPVITVDNIEVAQFVYLLLNNEKIRNVIDTIGRKGVLIIGRFTKERKAILHSIRDELRSRYDLLPIMFEFNPLSKDPTIRTLSTLAHLSRFVIADLTDAKSVLQELTTILHDLPTLPVKPIIHESDELPPMGDSFLIMKSMLKPYVYSTKDKLMAVLKEEVIDPAEDCVKKFESELVEIRQRWLSWQQK